MGKRTVVVLLVALALVAAPAMAQQLTGSISGVAKDNTGAPLPGVTVTATSPTLQGARTVVTRSDGTYKLVSLPVGKYKIDFTLSGFRTFEAANVEVRLGLDTQINATLALAQVKAEVVVTSEAPVVDVTQTNTQQNYNPDYLKKIPIGSGNRAYQSIVAQAAGVVGTGNPNVMGGNILENQYQIDGVNTTDPVTHTFSFNLNYDAIQEVSLQTSGYSAEYGRASGGIINVVTKAGGNEFSGTFDIRYDTNKFTENGDHFNNSQVESRNTPWGVTLGGPFIKDTLWFFANAQRADNFRTPFTTNTVILSQNPTPPVRRFTGWNTGGKLSFTVMPQLTGFFSVQDSFADIPGATDSAAVRPEATRTQEQKTRLYSLKVNGILSQNWFADLSLGMHRQSLYSYPTSGTDTVSQWTNRTQGNVTYDNYSNNQGGDRNRDLGGISTTYFVGNLLGNHQIKVGFDTDSNEFPQWNYTTGTPSDPSFCPGTDGRKCGATFTFNGFDSAGNRIPFRQTVAERLNPGTPTAAYTTKSRSYAAYFQDQWSPIKNLTFNFGLRWDETKYENNIGDNFMNFVKFQPRISAAWDITNDGKTRFSADYGHFYVDPALTFNRLFIAGYISPITRTYQWSTTTQRWSLINQTGGIPVTASLVDGPLLPTWDQQINVAFQREIMKGLSGTLTYVYKKTNDIFEDTCINMTDCPDFWVSNQPGRDIGITDVLTKNYYAYMLQIDYRFARGQFSGSYTYSKSQGSTDAGGTQYAGDDFDWYPDNFVNRYGYLGDDSRNRFKLYGYYRIPFIETDFSLAYNYRSGLPYNVVATSPGGWGNIYVEPRGTSRTTVLHNLDVELKKEFNLGARFRITPIFSVFNVFSQEQPTAYGTSTASPSTLRQPTAWNRPRNYQIGFRVDWN